MHQAKPLVTALSVVFAASLLNGCAFEPAHTPSDAAVPPLGTAPLLVPHELPQDYRWSGPNLVGTQNLAVTAQSSILIPLDVDQLPVVEICVERPDRDLCPHGDIQLARSDGGHTIKIVLTGPGAESATTRRIWESVQLEPVDESHWATEQ